MDSTVAAAAPVEAPPRRPGVLLAVACAAQFVCVLDISIVNVALPPMQESLGLSATGLQWVVSSYTLTFAGFLLLGGRVGDLFGRKRTFVGGLVLFAVASLAAGLAQEGWQVVAARFVQGVGGAVLVPTTLSLITTGFPEPRAKAKALSLLTAAAASGGALGGVIGGLLTGLLSWRWVFFVNVPLGVVLLLAAVWALPGRPLGHVRGRLDLPGSISVTAGTAALVAAVILGEERGFASAEALALRGPRRRLVRGVRPGRAAGRAARRPAGGLPGPPGHASPTGSARWSAARCRRRCSSSCSTCSASSAWTRWRPAWH